MTPRRREQPSVAALERVAAEATAAATRSRAQRDRLAEALSSSVEGVVVVDADGIEVFRNAAAARYRHARHSDAVAESTIASLLEDALAGVSCERELRLFGPPATILNLRALPLTDDGISLGAVVLIHDVSEIHRVESVRRDFVANVSHELKTPVGAMGLLAEALLASSEDQDMVNRFAEKIVTESTRLANMVGELIELSRLQGAEPLPHLDAVDVDSVVAEVVSRHKVAADNADIAITTDAPRGYQVLGSETLLATALANLVSNAISYSPKGSQVSVSRRRYGDNIEIAVTDRGIGIEKADQERVFERFFRVDKARSRATGGTGLGLAIVKHVAANHNGTIRLWSQPGTGSTFTLSIPAYLDSDDVDVDEGDDHSLPSQGGRPNQ